MCPEKFFFNRTGNFLQYLCSQLGVELVWEMVVSLHNKTFFSYNRNFLGIMGNFVWIFEIGTLLLVSLNPT